MLNRLIRLLMVAPLLLPVTISLAAPLKDPVDVQLPQGITQQEVSSAIKDALVGRGWTIEGEQPGAIKSTLYIRSHTATIQALYDASHVQFKYLDSTNLDYGVAQVVSSRHIGPASRYVKKTGRSHGENSGERQIHRNYNAWVDNLANDLRAQLSRRAFQ